MKFTEHKDLSRNIIKRYSLEKVQVNDQELTQSCIITHTTTQNWSAESLTNLTLEQLDELLALKPEILILGTGETQKIPSSELFNHCAKAGISLEAMNNAAACRTYNVLTTEDRQVVLGLILAE